MLIGLVLIALALNFLITPRAPPGPSCEPFCVDPAAEVACGGGVVFVGVLLVMSTIGRWRKVRRTMTDKPAEDAKSTVTQEPRQKNV